MSSNCHPDGPEAEAKRQKEATRGQLPQRQRSATSPSALTSVGEQSKLRTVYGPNVTQSGAVPEELISRWSATVGQPLTMDTTVQVMANQSLRSSLMSFQMPQNFMLPQVMPNFPNYLPSMPSMPSLHNYLPTLPTLPTQMPSLPTVSMPSMLSMPSMPALSMPNISIPSMPSMPNLPSIPSFSDFMNSNY